MSSSNAPNFARYQRQMLLPHIGERGQAALAAARAVVIGCGALGTTIADQLARAGIGRLTIVDRDIVELTNLQRQTLFDEEDARFGMPKAVAAANRLRAVNSEIVIEDVVADVHAGTIEELIKAASIVLDGTDNVATRYLINDVAVKHAIPWVYGAAVGTEGRMMAIAPPRTACLRCVFPTPPSPAELATCDTAGVLGMAASIIAAHQALAAIRMLTDFSSEPRTQLLRFDFWPFRSRAIDVEKSGDCPCCAQRRFEFLDAPAGDSAVTLCGRNAIQIRAATRTHINLDEMVARLNASGEVESSPYLVRCRLRDPAGISLTVFPDGRTLVQGTSDAARAKALHARFVGA